MSTTAAAAGNGHITGFGTKGYRGYVLGALLLAYIFNFIDRVIIAYLSGPIIQEFDLAYWQWGLLSGIAFATFYTFLGIPIARLAERFNRTIIIGVSIIFWSVMTALCGMATSYVMLLVARLGVGVGEAGLTPPANSLIADYFKPKSRGAALAIYSTGITIGSSCAALFLGLLLGVVTWRETFIVLGIAGIPVGLLILFTVKEPPRGYSDPSGTVRASPPGIIETMRALGKNATFWHVTMGGMLASFVGYGLVTFTMEFLRETLSLNTREVALQFLFPLALVGAVGTWLSGFLVSRFGGKSALWLPGGALILAMVFHLIALNVPVFWVVFGALVFANVFQYFYLGPMYAVAGNVVDARSRATAIAILLFVVNLIGYGLGPLFAGFMNDLFTGAQLADVQGLTAADCVGSMDGLNDQQQAVCGDAKRRGIASGLSVTVLFFLWASAHFFLAMRTIQKDLVAK